MDELRRLAEMLQRGAISRREFFGRTAALGAAGALNSAMPFAAEAAETVKKGGALRLGLDGASDKDSLEPASYADSVMIVVGRALYNSLVELAADGTAKPELAASWEAKDGAKTWIVNLRKGVRFSNGQEFTAEDALYSLNLHRGDSSSGAARAMKAVVEVKKLDKYQIQISLSAADADFIYVLTDARVMMAPDGFKDWSKPVGTGGYLIEKFDPGVRVALKKAPDYWRAGEGRGNLDAAEITVTNDGAARLNGLVSGQFDVINRVDPKAAALLQKTPKIEIVRSPSGWFAVLAMEIDKPPYDNPDIRLALKYAIDREQILKAALSGYGALGNDHPVPPGDPYFNKELPQRKHDSDRASFYFKRAGLADAKIVLQYSDAAFAGAADMAVLLQASAGKASIKIDLNKEPADGFWDNVWLKGPFVESYWAGAPAATQILSAAFRAGAPLNETHWSNDKFEKLLADAKSETDEVKRKGYIWEMQAMLRDDGGAVIPMFRDWIDAHRDNVGGHSPHGGLEMDNGYIVDKAFLRS
ncbi:MAG TPA: ABC transporter substrate-binding protein [Roseiarcus sp.]|nr:ABC transporter substrate-binding protein [Roseiarcus sp.]